MSIGNNIRKARGRIKQADLAEMLNVDVSTISRWENNKNIPNGEMLAKIAQILNTSTEFLLGNSSSQTQNINQEENDSFDPKVLITGGIANNMLIINDKKSDRVYYLPNDEEGRKLFLSILANGLQGYNSPLVSNSINGDHNSGNNLAIVKK